LFTTSFYRSRRGMGIPMFVRDTRAPED
jgi:hypothetical protein